MTIIARLKSDTELEWLHDKAVATGSWETFSEIAAKQSVIFIAPAKEILLLKVSLPPMRAHKLLQAVPFAVEELLSEEVGTYHFALPPHTDNAAVFVAVVSKERLLFWLNLCSTHHIAMQALYPETLLLAMEPNTWTIALSHDEAIVRTGPLQGFGVLRDNLNFFLESLEGVDAPAKINVLNYTGTQYTADASVVVTERGPENYLPDLTEHIATCPINLLQGEFRQRQKRDQIRKLFSFAIICVALSAILLFVNDVVEIFIFDARNQTLNASIAAIYQQNFPDSKSVIAPKERLQQKLMTVESGASGSLYLDILARVGKTLKNTDDIKIMSLHYNNHTMTIVMTTSRFEQLKLFVDRLQSMHLTVTQKSASTKDELVTATLVLTEVT